VIQEGNPTKLWFNGGIQIIRNTYWPTCDISFSKITIYLKLITLNFKIKRKVSGFFALKYVFFLKFKLKNQKDHVTLCFRVSRIIWMVSNSKKCFIYLSKLSTLSTFYVHLFCTKVFEQLFSTYFLALNFFAPIFCTKNECVKRVWNWPQGRRAKYLKWR